MNNKTYIDKKQIGSVNVFAKRYLRRVYSKHFKARKFLGWTLREEGTRYSTCENPSYDNTYPTPHDAIKPEHVYVKEIEEWYYVCSNPNAFEFDEEHNVLYLKMHIIINVGMNKYIKFFDNETELQAYIKDLGLNEYNLFGLEYDY